MVCSAKTLSIDFLQPCVHVFLASQEIGCGQAACATRVWVWMSWLLTLQDGKGGFEFVGNGFQVKDKDARKVMRNASSFNSPKFDSLLSVFSFQDIQSIDDLKKVQTSSEILFVSCSGNIFQKRRDKDWAQQTFLQSVLWVHGLHSCPILCPNVQTWCFD